MSSIRRSERYTTSSYSALIAQTAVCNENYSNFKTTRNNYIVARSHLMLLAKKHIPIYTRLEEARAALAAATIEAEEAKEAEKIASTAVHEKNLLYCAAKDKCNEASVKYMNMSKTAILPGSHKYPAHLYRVNRY